MDGYRLKGRLGGGMIATEWGRKFLALIIGLALALATVTAVSADDGSNNGGNNNDGDGIVNS